MRRSTRMSKRMRQAAYRARRAVGATVDALRAELAKCRSGLANVTKEWHRDLVDARDLRRKLERLRGLES